MGLHKIKRIRIMIVCNNDLFVCINGFDDRSVLVQILTSIVRL